jgi:lipid A oxidase
MGVQSGRALLSDGGFLWLGLSRDVPRRIERWPGGLFERCVVATAALCLAIWSFHPLVAPWMEMALPTASGAGGPVRQDGGQVSLPRGENMAAFYVSNPLYYRSNLHYVRNDGTNLKLYGMGWDGDPLYFPIDGGVRWVRWAGNAGFMIDFFHDKAIARLGYGAHGRKLRYPVVEEVPASGTLKGKPAPARIRLTDLFERFEFTHGHNMLFFTGMMRMSSPVPRLVPYGGLGAGVTIPHTEVRFRGEGHETRTSEYQLAGPAAQLVAGVEFRFRRVSYFVEYKFSYSWIWGAMTGGRSWKNWNLFGDLWRQFNRWRKGERPKYGHFYTTLGAHQINFGVGYRWSGRAAPVRSAEGKPAP